MTLQHAAIAAWQRFGTRDLRRIALWGFAAAFALLTAAIVATTNAGRDRLAQTATRLQGDVPARRPEPEDGARKLAETVQSLTADRDRLAARLDVLERNVGEITGSIARHAPAAAVAQPAPVPMPPVPPEVTPAAPPQTAMTSATPVPPVPPEPGRREFGIDLGGAANVDGLRALWAAARTKHGGLLEGLRPIVAIRENPRPGGMELRLVVGPFANAAAAARLCSVIAASGATCQPALFDGQRLAAR
jgi:hypothetical protein